MHVWPAIGYLAEPRRLERMIHLRDFRQELSASDIHARKTDILKTVIREIPSLMARGAAPHAIEDHETALCFVRNGSLVTRDPGIERRSCRDDGAFVCRERCPESLRA